MFKTSLTRCASGAANVRHGSRPGFKRVSSARAPGAAGVMMMLMTLLFGAGSAAPTQQPVEPAQQQPIARPPLVAHPPAVQDHPGGGALPALVPDRLVVNFEPVTALAVRAGEFERTLRSGLDSLDAIAAQLGVRTARRQFPGRDSFKVEKPRPGPDLAGWYVIEFDSDRMTIEQAVALYAAHPGVLDAQPVGIHPVSLVPNDPSYASGQWHLNQVANPGGPDINAPQVWDLVTGDADVIIAVLDTGVRYFHQDLGGSAASLATPMGTDGNVWLNLVEKAGGIPGAGVDDDANGFIDDWVGWDFVASTVNCAAGEDCAAADNDPRDFDGHGTHCAGNVAAINNNGYAAASPAGGFGDGTHQPAANGCKVMCLRIGHDTISGQGVVTMDAVASALVYAADNGAQIASCSFGTSNTGGVDDAVNAFTAAGGLVIAAAGNDNSSLPHYFCTRSDVVCVAATDQDDLKASFSNYGSHIDIAAPGVDILSLYHESSDPATDYIAVLPGTSMACPLVAGGAALVWSVNPAWTAAQVRQQLQATADDLDALNPAYAGLLGSGRLNLQAAVGTAEILAACCLGSACTEMTQADCDLQGGIWQKGASCFELIAAVGDPSPNLDIPDGNPVGVSHAIVVAEDEEIIDLDLTLSIAHTWVGDLVVTLSRDSGPTVTVIDRPGIPPAGFGCSAANYINIELDDEATGGPIESQCQFNLTSPPGYTPHGLLSAFDGFSTQGTWTLTVTDLAGSDVGTLDSWSLSFTTADETVCVEPTGACCLGSGCEQLTAGECDDQGGAYLGDGILCEAVSYMDDPQPDIAIPDAPASDFSRTLIVSDSFVIENLDIAMQIAHLNYGDLIIQLTHTPTDPDVPIKTVTLMDGSNDTSNLVSGGIYRFNAEALITFDLAAMNAGGSAANIAFGDYQPDLPLGPNGLTQLYGRDAEGTWKLDIIDDGPNGETATLYDWTLEFTSTVDPCDDPCASDSVPPVVLCLPGSVAIGSGGSVLVTAADLSASALDACDGPIAELTFDPPSFSCGQQGSHAVTVTAVDLAGNEGSCATTVMVTAADLDADGADTCTDCDDADPFNYPGNDESCDGQDNDCDGLADEGTPNADGDALCDGLDPDDDNDNVADGEDSDPLDSTQCSDADGDGCDDCASGAFDPLSDGPDLDGDGLCDDGDGDDDGDKSPSGEDCDDADPFIHPGAAEVPYDGIDQDCDGADLCDVDGDGHDSTSCAGGGDCDDGDPAIHPGVGDGCDGVDNDCDGFADEDFSCDDGDDCTVDSCDAGECQHTPQDLDDDGFTCLEDCDDLDDAIHPGVEDICDGIDNDCDSSTDEDIASCDDNNPCTSDACTAGECIHEAIDADADGSPCGEDCDEADAGRYPGPSKSAMTESTTTAMAASTRPMSTATSAMTTATALLRPGRASSTHAWTARA